MKITTYRVTGRLVHPVNDVQAARHFLRERGQEMEQYIYPEWLQRSVHTVRWDLEGSDTWEVIVVANHVLAPSELELLSSWISGQNSDGLGEGFEQQPFAEHPADEEDEEEEDEGILQFIQSSFDWQTNPCTLVRVK